MTAIDATLDVVVIERAAHPSPAVQRAGFLLDSPYLERCWLPVLGPSCTLLLRRFAREWEHANTFTTSLHDLAVSTGLGGGTTRNSPIWRTLHRLVQFQFASWSTRAGGHELEVFDSAEPVPARLLQRTPDSVQAAHDQLVAEHLRQLGVLYGTTS